MLPFEDCTVRIWYPSYVNSLENLGNHPTAGRKYAFGETHLSVSV